MGKRKNLGYKRLNNKELRKRVRKNDIKIKAGNKKIRR